MSTGALVMMAIAILVVWGGLVVAILNLRRGDTEDAAYVDVSKIQQLAFTALVLMIYGAALFGMFGAGREIVKFPDVDAGFVSLLGLSHAAYLAYKAAPKPT